MQTTAPPRSLLVAIVLAALACAARPAFAQYVVPDLWGAYNGGVYAMDLRGDSLLYIGGNFDYVGPQTGGAVPLNVLSGASAREFPRVHGAVDAIAIDPAGGWYIAGSFDSVGTFARANLAHVNADLTVSAWNPGSNQEVLALVATPTAVYVGGYFSQLGADTRNGIGAIHPVTGAVLPWNPDASITGSPGSVYSLAVSGSNVYAGGLFTHIGGQDRSRIAALDTTTALATTWNPNVPSGLVLTIAPGLGVIYFGGTFTQVGVTSRLNLAAVDAVTGALTTWNPTADSPVNDMYLTGSTLYVGGSFVHVGGAFRSSAAALSTSTGTATAWDPGAVDGAIKTILRNANTVYVGGGFSTIGGLKRTRLAALDATTAVPNAWNPGASANVNTLAIQGDRIYAGGTFQSVGGVARSRLAAIDLHRGVATSWNPSANANVFTIASSDSAVFVGGSFTQVGGQSRTCLAKLDPATGLATPWNPQANNPIIALLIDGNKLYAGGSVTKFGNDIRLKLGALDVTTGQLTAWNPNITDGQVEALALHDGNLFVGGTFSTVGAYGRGGIAEIDTTTGIPTDWDPSAGPGGSGIFAMAFSGTSVYVGGAFSSIGGKLINNAAQLDLGTGLATNWNPNPSSSVVAMGIAPSGVYAGGNFQTIGGGANIGLVGLDPTTGLATSWSVPLANTGTTYCLVMGHSALYAGGLFDHMGNVRLSNLAAIVVPTVGVGDAPAGAPAIAFAGARPNPLRDAGALEFDLPHAGIVSLDLFNARGRLVRHVLSEQWRAAGPQRVPFARGRLAAGLYFAELRFGSARATSKIVVAD